MSESSRRGSVAHRAPIPVGLVLVFTVGLLMVSGHILHAIDETENVASILTGVLLPLLFALCILLGGVYLWRADYTPEDELRVGFWLLLMTGAFAVGQLMTIVYQAAEGATMSHVEFLVLNAASAGGLVGLIVGGYDIKQRKARAKTEQLKSRLSVLNRVLRHDIRNGATVIKGRAALIEEGTNGANHAAHIRSQADSLVALGEQAREIEQLQAEVGQPRERVDVIAAIDSRIDEIRNQHAGVRVERDLAEERYVAAHPMIGSAIANILHNGVKHNDRSEPRIEVSTHVVQREGQSRLVLRFADDGPGIPPAEVEVLERGYETPLDHTSGLGLWVVNWVIRTSGGAVWFEENSPRGSVVCIELDLASESQSVNEPEITG